MRAGSLLQEIVWGSPCPSSAFSAWFDGTGDWEEACQRLAQSLGSRTVIKPIEHGTP
jgi:hypothetical protein